MNKTITVLVLQMTSFKNILKSFNFCNLLYFLGSVWFSIKKTLSEQSNQCKALNCGEK